MTPYLLLMALMLCPFAASAESNNQSQKRIAAPAAAEDDDGTLRPPSVMYLCVAHNGELVFQRDACDRGWKPIRAAYSESSSARPQIARATRLATTSANTFGEPPDPTAGWTQHARVPDEVTREVLKAPALSGNYEVSVTSDIEGVRRTAKAVACLENARPYEFLDVYALTRASPHLPPVCNLGHWHVTAGHVDYTLTCTQRGKTITRASSLTLNRTQMRHAQTVVDAAPSDYIRGDRVYALQRIGACD